MPNPAVNTFWTVIGGLSLAGILAACKYFWQKKFPPVASVTPPPGPPAGGAALTAPTPEQIYNAIEKLPPLSQPAVAAGYAGLQVRWRLVFRHASLQSQGRAARVMFQKPQDGLPIVYCDFDLQMYPELKTTHVGTAFTVQGVISSVDGISIHLNNAAILREQDLPTSTRPRPL